jgi:hypothetical protein
MFQFESPETGLAAFIPSCGGRREGLTPFPQLARIRAFDRINHAGVHGKGLP